MKAPAIFTVGKDLHEIADNMNEAIALYLEDNPAPCEALHGDFVLNYKINAATHGQA